ncbi:hypothetical protein [Erythrobacter litoralis]|uniref:Uncharacterized protein n=1 Tax=Erythrobacter litoralis (strain HTCC2594) TaxID=314225 RepID=Q2N9Q8_ERYLH|nr:hypothetical protein [Erythrobacter litoralis]ABC63583.1 hypothetical protein ELI_07455 [Erythrobacter litoralis HTCC2594]
MNIWLYLLAGFATVLMISGLLNIAVRRFISSYKARSVFAYFVIPTALVGLWVAWSWEGLYPWTKAGKVFVGPLFVLIFAGISWLSNLVAERVIE